MLRKLNSISGEDFTQQTRIKMRMLHDSRNVRFEGFILN